MNHKGGWAKGVSGNPSGGGRVRKSARPEPKPVRVRGPLCAAPTSRDLANWRPLVISRAMREALARCRG